MGCNADLTDQDESPKNTTLEHSQKLTMTAKLQQIQMDEAPKKNFSNQALRAKIFEV